MKRESIRYSESFKRQVVSEIESGRHRTVGSATRAYGIGGSCTVRRWVKQYGSSLIQTKVVRVATMKEQDELKKARRRVKDLEVALSDAHIDYSLEHAYLEVACEKMGLSLDEFKKKYAMTLSDVRRRKRGVR